VRGFDPEGDVAGFASRLDEGGGTRALPQSLVNVVPLHELEPVHGGGEAALESDLQAGLGFMDAGESIIAAPPVTAPKTAGRDEEENSGRTQNQLPLQDGDAAGESAIGGLSDAVGDTLNGEGFRLGDAGLEAGDFGIGGLAALVESVDDFRTRLRRDSVARGGAVGEEADLMGEGGEQRHHRIVALDTGVTRSLTQFRDQGLDIFRGVLGDGHGRRRRPAIGRRERGTGHAPPPVLWPMSQGTAHGSQSATGAKAVSMVRRQVAIC
jgi:hypothetical protein